MDVCYEKAVRVGAAESGICYQCRPAGLLSLLQEAATEASCDIHVSGPEMVARYNAIWMVARTWYRLDRPLMWGDRLTIRTWHRANRGAALYRDFDLLVDGTPVGEAVSLWVLADAENRRMLRMSKVTELTDTGGGGLCKDKTLAALHLPDQLDLLERRRFHYSDTDSNGHVNNVRYADWIADAAGLEKLMGNRFVSALQIGYLKECQAGESLDIYRCWEEGRCFVSGMDTAGQRRFDGVLTLERWNQG